MHSCAMCLLCLGSAIRQSTCIVVILARVTVFHASHSNPSRCEECDKMRCLCLGV